MERLISLLNLILKDKFYSHLKNVGYKIFSLAIISKELQLRLLKVSDAYLSLGQGNYTFVNMGPSLCWALFLYVVL